MNIRAKGKNWVKRSLLSSRALHFASRVRQPGVAILMYHSVMVEPEAHATTLGKIIQSAQTFRRQMEVIARHYNPVSLDDVLMFVQGQKKMPSKPVVVTFDDGYADNFEVAAPILNEFGIPAVFYITVDCVDKATPPWVSRLRYAFSTTGKRTWSGLDGKPLPLANAAERDQAFTTACEHAACLTGNIQEQFVKSVEREFEVGSLPERDRLMMTWEQARALTRQGHIVGSHTMTHPNLAHVRNGDLATELEQSKLRLEQQLSSRVIHFSYPCPILEPHWSALTVEVCRKVGYLTAVTTNPGPVHEGDDPLSLRRVHPTTGIDGLRWNLECTFLGRGM